MVILALYKRALMDKNKVLADHHTSTQNLLDQLSHFTIETFNQKPPDNGWSAAQISEHLLLLDMIANKVVAAGTIPTNRPPDEKIKYIKAAMEDQTKRTASERVQPTTEPKDPQAMSSHFQQQRASLEENIRTTDITDACISFKHPAFGTLTKLEWIYFTIYHTQRHLKQMQRLEEIILSQIVFKKIP